MNYLYAALATILLLIGDFAAGYYFRGQHDTAKVEKSEIKSDQTQMQQEAKQIQTNTASETQYVQDVKNPTPLIIKQPVWLRPPASIVSGTACPNGATTDPAPGPINAGSAVDLRPQLAEFARKYEAVIAGCREGARDWPSQTIKSH